MKGTVKWFNDAKGHGWIEPDDLEEVVYVEFSEICVDGFKSLRSGERVEFELERAGGRYCAKRVEPTERKGEPGPSGPERYI